MWLHTRSPWRTFTLPWSKGCWESKNRALLTAPFCLCLWLSSCTSTWKSGTHKAQTNEHSWSDECCWPALWRLHKYSTLHTLNVVNVPQNNAQGTFPHRGVNNNYRYGWSVIQNLFSFSFFFFTKYFHVTLYRHFFFNIYLIVFSFNCGSDGSPRTSCRCFPSANMQKLRLTLKEKKNRSLLLCCSEKSLHLSLTFPSRPTVLQYDPHMVRISRHGV